MAIKKRMRDGTIKYVTFKQEEDKDARIKRLEALLKEVTETLAEVTGYDKPVAAASTYGCYK
jgi:hypothetical protein